MLPHIAALSWLDELNAADDRVKISRLYKGGYWSVARQMVHDTHLPVRAWVASAGVGLREFTDAVPAYAATFNPGHSDTVPGGDGPGGHSGRLAWWKMIGGRDALRGLAEDDDRIVVALPGEYLRVVLPDLQVLQAQLGARALSVFTTDTEAIDALGTSAVPLEGRMRSVLGGPTGQLTVRALARVMEQAATPADLTPGRCRQVMADVLEEAPATTYPKRLRQHEWQVENWVREALASETPPTSASAALRQFRDAGFAYEQKKFGRLFRRIQGDQE
ncbi:MAG: hypothetical protein EP330_08680 [Deltaproteobacteria bacterium]|nr:MAG: hypothetical protein EP330_08680 [Deltaproteobacteria bacterium]